MKRENITNEDDSTFIDILSVVEVCKTKKETYCTYIGQLLLYILMLYK